MRLSTALISLTLATALASPAFAAGTMQMSGHGEIMAKPDTAYVTSGVTSQAATAIPARVWVCSTQWASARPMCTAL